MATLTHVFNHGPSASDFARTYNARTGGCNLHLATHLISLVKHHFPPLSATTIASPLRILDNACGPLVLTTALLDDDDVRACAGVEIDAVDVNAAFVANNQLLIDAMEIRPGVKVATAVMDGMDLGFPDSTFDVSFTSLAIFAFPDPVLGARELYRTLKPGGVAALTTWKRVGWLPLLHEVERLVRPGGEVTGFPFLEPWTVAGKLASTLREGGFEHVVEGEVVSYAWYDGEEKVVECISETLKMLLGSSWGGKEQEEISEGLRRVMMGGSECVLRGEGGKVGCEMVAWTGVGRK